LVDSWSYNQLTFDEDETYSIGFNDGREFDKIVYVGTKLLNGKSMICFKTKDKLDITVNPSYVSFYIKQTKKEEQHYG